MDVHGSDRKLVYNLFKGLITYLCRGYNPVTKYHGHPSTLSIWVGLISGGYLLGISPKKGHFRGWLNSEAFWLIKRSGCTNDLKKVDANSIGMYRYECYIYACTWKYVLYIY